MWIALSLSSSSCVFWERATNRCREGEIPYQLERNSGCSPGDWQRRYRKEESLHRAAGHLQNAHCGSKQPREQEKRIALPGLSLSGCLRWPAERRPRISDWEQRTESSRSWGKCCRGDQLAASTIGKRNLWKQQNRACHLAGQGKKGPDEKLQLLPLLSWWFELEAAVPFLCRCLNNIKAQWSQQTANQPNNTV